PCAYDSNAVTTTDRKMALPGCRGRGRSRDQQRKAPPQPRRHKAEREFSRLSWLQHCHRLSTSWTGNDGADTAPPSGREILIQDNLRRLSAAYDRKLNPVWRKSGVDKFGGSVGVDERAVRCRYSARLQRLVAIEERPIVHQRS